VPTPLEQLRSERRRKLQVRETFSRGLDHFRAVGGDATAFYLACADYLATGQRRLIDQDRRLVDTLAPRVPAAQQDDQRAMGALRERLDLAHRSLADFEAAVAELRRHGSTGHVAFEAASARFLDVLVNVLGARSHSLRHLTTTLLGEDDWQRIADVTPAFLESEAKSFASVSGLAPPGLEPEKMATGEQPGGGAQERTRTSKDRSTGT
jgi:NAD(P)-dependent dehydrogenase (short-subunit alcohol dehydrogenase family)